MDALKMAVANREPGVGEVIFHSDRGSQYTGNEFRSLCFFNGIIPSVGHTGICYDNAAAEYGSYVQERAHHRTCGRAGTLGSSVRHEVYTTLEEEWERE